MYLYLYLYLYEDEDTGAGGGRPLSGGAWCEAGLHSVWSSELSSLQFGTGARVGIFLTISYSCGSARHAISITIISDPRARSLVYSRLTQHESVVSMLPPSHRTHTTLTDRLPYVET